jgi:hypothetical protein
MKKVFTQLLTKHSAAFGISLSMTFVILFCNRQNLNFYSVKIVTGRRCIYTSLLLTCFKN